VSTSAGFHGAPCRAVEQARPASTPATTGACRVYEHDIESVLLDERQIQEKVAELAARISEDYEGRDVLLVGILKGGVILMADLSRALTVPHEIDFMAVSSYGASTETSGVVRLLKDLELDIQGRHVILVEDIVDSGLTLEYLVETLRPRRPASLEVCVLLMKPEMLKVDLEVRYKGFDIPSAFVVGYGLDYAERYRNLPYVATLKPEVYQQHGVG
jgi:hypoxanthine phosphoribosyltransferase